MSDEATWRGLFQEVPREQFIPDTIWVDLDPDDEFKGLASVSKTTDPAIWHAVVNANGPVITQVNLDQAEPNESSLWPSSSCSQPSIVAEMLAAADVRNGQSVLEIGTGTGWNAALLSRRAGEKGQVVTIEVDPDIADRARNTLHQAGYDPLVVVGDGAQGYFEAAPYDRIVCTAAIRELIPVAWLEQLTPDGLIVTPWSTDYLNGVLLSLTAQGNRILSGRFSGNLAFMCLRDQRPSLFGWTPEEEQISLADIRTTECRSVDLDRMLDHELGRFAIGARVANCYLRIRWDACGPRHHWIDLDDGSTKSFARLDWPVDDSNPYIVRQLGPRRLWDEVEAAYDWWHDQGEPRMDRFGFEVDGGCQWVWLDEPGYVVRVLRT